MAVKWTPESEDALRSLAADPLHFTANDIARALGVSRNAVIGKVHRLGLKLSGRSRPTRKPRPSRAMFQPLPPTTQREKLAAIPTTPAITSLQPKAFIDLGAGECRWVIDQPDGSYLFCADVSVDGFSYCGPHCRMAHGRAA